MGWSRKEIAEKLGITTQYVGLLLRRHKENQRHAHYCDYGLSTRVLNCLKRNKIPLDLQVIAESIDLLLHMRGIGEAALNEIGSILLRHGIIYNIEEWKEDGKKMQYNRRESYSEMLSCNFS